MIDADLSWQQAAVLTSGLAVTAAVLIRQGTPAPADDSRARARKHRLRVTAAFVREGALICGLFTLWQFAGNSTRLGHAGAYDKGAWLWHVERLLAFPNETSVQAAFLPHPLLVQILNLYYDILHFPVLIGTMLWLFIWHRDRYPRFRTIIVSFTGICLLIQLIPVAPPRLLPQTGMVDTALRYGQSVYDPQAGFEANQFSAMPSVHVGWAILVAMGIIGVARTRWRWLALLYPALTSLIVVITANHYWLDGVAAAAIIMVVLPVQAAIRRLPDHRKARRAEPAPPVPAPGLVPGADEHDRAGVGVHSARLSGTGLAGKGKPEETGLRRGRSLRQAVDPGGALT